MDISVVIPNYNGENLLRNNFPKVIEELKKYKGGKVEFIVVDDGSKDKSLEVLEELDKKFPGIKVFTNEKNRGFSVSVNKGVRASSGDIVLLLNTDVYPEKGFLGPLIEHFDDPDVFAVGCLDKSIEGDTVVLRGRGLGQWKRGFLVHRRGEVDKSNTLWVSGGSGAFKKSIWDKLSGLNELYSPFYWEDIDLSYRAQKSGYKVLFEPKSMVYHEHEKGAIKSVFSPNFVKTTAYRNQFIFVWENASDLKLKFLHLLWLPYHLLKALFRGDTAFFYGFFKALFLLPAVIQSKANYAKLFVKSDREVIKGYLE